MLVFIWLILFGDDRKELTQLVQHFLTALNFQEFKTKYIHIKNITQEDYYVSQIARKYDVIAIDGLGNLVGLTHLC